MFEIKNIAVSNEKAAICGKILCALPDWFGNEEARDGYIEGSRDKPFFAAFRDSEAVGFAAVKAHNEHTAEIYVIGVFAEYHRMGAGRLLIQSCEEYCVRNGFSFLTVKTLAGLHPDEGYARTRKFYLGTGFLPLEVFPLHWDVHNPCLFMAKFIKQS